MKKRWQILLGLVLSGFAFLVIISGVNWDEVGRIIAHANYWWSIPFILLEALSLWARGVRWRVLLEEKVGSRRLFWITNISYYLSNVLPLRIGEVARVYLVTQGTRVSGMQAVSTAVLERLIDILTVFTLLFAVLPLVPQQGLVNVVAYWLVAGVLFAVLVVFALAKYRVRVVDRVGRLVGIFPRRWTASVAGAAAEFLLSIENVRGRRIITAVAWSFVVWILASVATYCMLLAFLPAIPVYSGFFATGIIALGIALPSMPAGVGLWEAATVASLAVFGVDKETALAVGVAMHLLIFVEVGVLGMIGLQYEGENLNHLSVAARRFMRAIRRKPEGII